MSGLGLFLRMPASGRGCVKSPATKTERARECRGFQFRLTSLVPRHSRAPNCRKIRLPFWGTEFFNRIGQERSLVGGPT